MDAGVGELERTLQPLARGLVAGNDERDTALLQAERQFAEHRLGVRLMHGRKIVYDEPRDRGLT